MLRILQTNSIPFFQGNKGTPILGNFSPNCVRTHFFFFFFFKSQFFRSAANVIQQIKKVSPKSDVDYKCALHGNLLENVIMNKYLDINLKVYSSGDFT